MAFVYETLFPYARRALREFVVQNRRSPEFEAVVDRLRSEHAADAAAGHGVPPWDVGPEGGDVSVVRYVGWLMDRDRKSPALKELQGRIWKDGYESGALVGQVFEDVPRALRRWREAGLVIAVFSSGSVLAQQLLFRHSSAGDLTPWLDRHFDTAVGAKTDGASYRTIAESLGVAPEAILFISDSITELDAARSAGLRTALSVRPGNSAADAQLHPMIRSFDALR